MLEKDFSFLVFLKEVCIMKNNLTKKVKSSEKKAKEAMIKKMEEYENGGNELYSPEQ